MRSWVGQALMSEVEFDGSGVAKWFPGAAVGLGEFVRGTRESYPELKSRLPSQIGGTKENSIMKALRKAVPRQLFLGPHPFQSAWRMGRQPVRLAGRRGHGQQR